MYVKRNLRGVKKDFEEKYSEEGRNKRRLQLCENMANETNDFILISEQSLYVEPINYIEDNNDNNNDNNDNRDLYDCRKIKLTNAYSIIPINIYSSPKVTEEEEAMVNGCKSFSVNNNNSFESDTSYIIPEATSSSNLETTKQVPIDGSTSNVKDRDNYKSNKSLFVLTESFDSN